MSFKSIQHIRIEPIALNRLKASSSLFQRECWAEIKSFTNWKAHAFLFETPFLLLTKPLILRYQIAYIPFLSLKREEISLATFASQLRPLLPKQVAFIRIDLNWDSKPFIDESRYRLHYSIQPEATVQVDLRKEFWLEYRERATRQIAKCKREGIVVSLWDKKNEKEFKKWYQLYSHTASDSHFSARSSDYLRHILLCEEAELYLAFDCDEIVGGIIVLSSAKKALYLFGSSDKKRPYSAAYLLQDFAMRELKEREVELYDLYGISSEGQRDSHLSSLNLFKTSFGGRVVTRSPSLDYPYKKLFYPLYKKVEQVWFALKRK